MKMEYFPQFMKIYRSQLCINTAIVYMHRFYVFHSLTQFHRNAIAVASLFLAAKVEEQPRKLEHVIKMAYMCLHREQAPPDSRSDVSFNNNKVVSKYKFQFIIKSYSSSIFNICILERYIFTFTAIS